MLISLLVPMAGSTSSSSTQTFWQAVGDWMKSNAIIIVLTIVVSFIIWWILVRLIRRVTQNAKNRLDQQDRPGQARGVEGTQELTAVLMSQRREQRFEAISQLLRSITTFSIVTLALLIILGQLGVNMAPLLASAGVIGVALGFGAQTLVKDFLSGIFLVLEDQFGVGDVVDLGPATGTVEEVTLRVTRIRDLSGVVWYVRNGEILRVGNQSQGWARAVLDVNIGYTENIDHAESVLLETAQQVRADPRFRTFIIDEPEVWGVEALTTEGVVMRLVVKTQPLQQWVVARELRRKIKQRFDAEDIEMRTMPRTLIVNGDDEEPEPPTRSAADADALDQ